MNANKIPILEGGAKFTPLTVNPEESQFIATRTFQIDEVSRWTGVPPHMLAELSRGTFSNIEHMSLEYVRYVAQPWTTRFEKEADRKLFAPVNRTQFFTRINLNALLRGDTNARRGFYETMHRIGALSPNEIRQLEELNRYNGGDVYVNQRQMTPVQELGSDTTAETDAGQLTAKQRDAELAARVSMGHGRLIARIAGRLVNKQAIAAPRQAHKTPEAFDRWAREFYPKLIAEMTEDLTPVALSLVEIISGRDLTVDEVQHIDAAVGSIAEDYLDAAAAELAEAHASGTIDQLVALWIASAPQQIAAAITDRIATLLTFATQQETDDEPDPDTHELASVPDRD